VIVSLWKTRGQPAHTTMPGEPGDEHPAQADPARH